MGRRQGRPKGEARDEPRLGAAVSAAVMVSAVLAACAGRGGGEGGPRPLVERSAAEVFASGSDSGLDPLTAAATDQLNFFDELETRGLAAQDDVLHACLLVGAGVAPATYEHRVEMARRLGWIGDGRGGEGAWPFDGREATTLADAGRIILRMLGQDGGLSDDRVLRRLREQGYIPEGLETYQGLTGGQLIWLVSRAHDDTPSSAVVRARRVLEGVKGASGEVAPPADRPDEIVRVGPGDGPLARREDEVIEPARVDPPPTVDEPVGVEPARRASRFVPGTPLRRTGAPAEGASAPPAAGPR